MPRLTRLVQLVQQGNKTKKLLHLSIFTEGGTQVSEEQHHYIYSVYSIYIQYIPLKY